MHSSENGKWTRGGAVGPEILKFHWYYLFYDSIKLQLTEIYNHKVWKALLKLKKKKNHPTVVILQPHTSSIWSWEE